MFHRGHARGLIVCVLSGIGLAACGDSNSAGGGQGGKAGGAAGQADAGPGGQGGGLGGQSGVAGSLDAGPGGADAAGAPDVDASDTDVSFDVADAADAADLSADVQSDLPAPAPIADIPSAAIDFGAVACGSAGGGMPVVVTNSGNAPLHYRAVIAAGGIFSLQGAAADGSVSGDVAPGDNVGLTIVAGTIGTTTADGASFLGSLAVVTNASGAENVQIPLKMKAEGGLCTLTCAAFTKCTPATGAPYCANTATDNSNCGTCGHACAAGEVCSGGACAITCAGIATCTPTGAAPYCANTQTDRADCGTCGHACGTGEICTAGACVLTCGALTKCAPSAGGPYCANTATDGANCGTCGTVCGVGEICTGGACVLTCGALTKCTPSAGGPYCANTATDNADCGTCGHACGTGEMCAGGACVLTCGALTKCTPNAGAAYCANTTTDNVNCGACGHTCPAGQACVMGACASTCAAAESVCGGACTNTSFDPSNCGMCGRKCAFANGAAACVGGGCYLASCTAGFADCDRDQTTGCEVNTATDGANCGACGHACALGETCHAGACSADLSQGLIGYWNLDDAFGSAAAADSSPNHLNGQLQGNVTFDPAGGKQGTGAAMFGGGGYIRVVFPNNAKGQGSGVSIPQGNITFAMWFKTSSANVGGLQVVEGGTWGPGCDRVVGNGASNTLMYNAWNEVNMSEAFVVNDGVWHQMVYVLDKSAGFKAYIDGVLEVSDATPTSNCGVGCSGFDWASEYWIGRSAGCRFGADYFTGLIDDVRIYDHALPPSTVVQLFNATK